MARTRPQSPSPAARRVGFVVAALINVVLLYLVNVWPDWQALPLLTDDAGKVIGLVNLSLLVSLIVNVAYLFYIAGWFESLGNLLTTAVGLAVLVQLWRVFPFEPPGSSFNWSMVARLVLAVAIFGTVIGLIVSLVSLVRRVLRGRTGAAS